MLTKPRGPLGGRGDHRADEAVIAEFGQSDCVFFAIERGDRRDGAEELFIEGAHPRLHIGQDIGFMEGAVATATRQKTRSAGDGVLNDPLHPFGPMTVDQGTQRHVAGHWVTRGQVLSAPGDVGAKFFCDRLVNQDTTAGHADLTLMQEGAEGGVGGAAISTSASSRMIKLFLPPSSSWTFFSAPPAMAPMLRPAAVEPVKAIITIFGSLHSASRLIALGIARVG